MWKVVVLQVLFGIVFVKCSIPATLNVQKLDPKLIERKRQDTLEMCRLFSENNHKLEVINSANSLNQGNNRRAKRDINVSADGDRVEVLVDKMYDDLAEKGDVVNYKKKTKRTQTVATVTAKPTKQPLNNSRRFFFAPAIVDTAEPEKGENNITSSDIGGVPVPWRKKWKHGIVPYFIDAKTYDNQLSETIMNAFAYIEKATCIRLQKLRERPTDDESLLRVEWLYITNPSGIRQCVHSNEHKMNKGVQMVVFGYDCMSLGEIVHEIMHVLGFSHEHTRSDRDDHLTILWDNIKPGYKKYFEVRESDLLNSLPYDFASVLHYPPRAFSKNGKLTISAEPGVKLGQREGFSETDIEKIGMVYGYECIDRNRQYLLDTCPSAIKGVASNQRASDSEINDYFENKTWPYGIVNYRLRDKLEFTIEERENIAAVITHIEKETCIEFRDIEADKSEGDETDDPDDTTILTNPSGNGTDPTESGTEMDNNIDNVDDEANNDQRRKNNKETYYKANKKAQKNTKKASSLRRHAENILTFVRSAEPGCHCPKPGKPEGDQVLQINHDCFNSVNDLLHLFVHLLGLDHQHNTFDRDSYLHIDWNKLTDPELKQELETLLPPPASVGFPYDYQSVMHYPWLEIKHGLTSIMYPIWNDGWVMGRWQGLSSIDIQKLDRLYAKQCALRRKASQNQEETLLF